MLTRLARFLLLCAAALGAVIMASATLAGPNQILDPWMTTTVAKSHRILAAVHPGILASFQVLVSITALLAFSPDE